MAMNGVFCGLGIKAKAFDCPHVLVGHFNVRGARISDTQQLIGVDIEIFKETQMREALLVALGKSSSKSKLDINTISDSLFFDILWNLLKQKNPDMYLK